MPAVTAGIGNQKIQKDIIRNQAANLILKAQYWYTIAFMANGKALKNHKKTSIKLFFTRKLGMYSFAFAFSLFFTIFIVPITESYSFINTEILPDRSYPILLKVGFFATLFLGVIGLAHFIKQLVSGNPFYTLWLKFFGGYAGLMSIFLLLLYPGHWLHDEFDILSAVTNYQPVAWHGLLSNLFYTYSLYLFPSALSIILIQLIIISLIVAWTLATIYSHIRQKRMIILVILLFISVPVIVNNLYPLRLTLYSYAEFLLAARMLFLLIGYRKIQNPFLDITATALLVAIVATWRTEGIYYILFIPFYLYLIDIKRLYRQNQPKIICAVIFSCITLGLFIYLGSLNNIPRYRLTSTVGTLSNMMRYPLKGNEINEKLDSINKVIDINVLRQMPSYDEIPAFWTEGSLRNGYENHIDGYNAAVLYIIAHNPDVYLKVRSHTFLSTNAIGSGYTPMPFGPYIPKLELPQYVQAFNIDHPFVKPLNIELKYTITRALLQTDDAYKPKPLAAFIWTVIPALLALITSIFILLWKKRFSLAILLSFIFAHALLIYATAPANYFMYYFSVYLIGGLSTAVLLTKWIDDRYYQRHRQ